MSTAPEIPGLKKRLTANELFVGSLSVDKDKVGVGTTTPSEQLHLTGNLRVDGNLRVADKLAVGGFEIEPVIEMREDGTISLQGLQVNGAIAGQGLRVGGNAQVDGDLTINGGDLHVDGKLVLAGFEIRAVTLRLYEFVHDSGQTETHWFETPPTPNWKPKGPTKQVLKMNDKFIE